MSHPIRVLIAEDEKGIRLLLRDYLKKEGFEVLEAANGLEAIQQFGSHPNVDLVILDVMMPVLNGYEVCGEIRKTSDVPILFLTALGETHDQLNGFSAGADDYIVKPFEYKILMARVQAMLRRTQGSGRQVYQYHQLQVDEGARQVSVSDIPVVLAPKEYELLVFFIANKNIALDRDTLLNSIWGTDFYGDPRTVDTHIKNLRAKLGVAGEWIKTVRGHGYRLEVQ